MPGPPRRRIQDSDEAAFFVLSQLARLWQPDSAFSPSFTNRMGLKLVKHFTDVIDDEHFA
jgi:hypothetical protein